MKTEEIDKYIQDIYEKLFDRSQIMGNVEIKLMAERIASNILEMKNNQV
jgi:hypothetical protein